MSENKSEEPALFIYGDQTIYWTHSITSEQVRKVFVEQVEGRDLHCDEINADEKMRAFVRETYPTRFEGLDEEAAEWLEDELCDQHYNDKYQEIINEYVDSLSTKQMLDALHNECDRDLAELFDLNWSLDAATDGSRIRVSLG